MNQQKKNNVILLRLPSHLTHLLQPLDTSVFQPVKSKWQSLLLKYAKTHYGPVSKKHFPGLLHTLFQSSITIEQVKSGFRRTGIFTFNKDAIDTSSFKQCPQVVMSTKNAAEKHTLPTPTVPCSTQVLPTTSAHNASASTSLLCVSYSTSLSTSSSGKSSIRDFFLKELQPRFAQTSVGKSHRSIPWLILKPWNGSVRFAYKQCENICLTSGAYCPQFLNFESLLVVTF